MFHISRNTSVTQVLLRCPPLGDGKKYSRPGYNSSTFTSYCLKIGTSVGWMTTYRCCSPFVCLMLMTHLSRSTSSLARSLASFVRIPVLYSALKIAGAVSFFSLSHFLLCPGPRRIESHALKKFFSSSCVKACGTYDDRFFLGLVGSWTSASPLARKYLTKAAMQHCLVWQDRLFL